MVAKSRAVAVGFALGCAACLLGGLQASEARRPNILLVVLDDVGWKDLGSYGGEFDTPNIDRLAEEGARFTNAYSPAPICSASRVAIFTGKSPARSHFEFVTKWPDDKRMLDGHKLIPPPFALNMPLSEVTLAEALKPAGYETAFFGKWHVSTHYKRYKGWSPTHGPLQQGFEVAEEDFGNHPYSENYPRADPDSVEPGSFPEDSMTERVARYLKGERDKPFFLMVSFFYAHTPVKAPATWLKEKYLEALPQDESLDRRAEYGAFIESMDHYVGQLLNALDEQGLAEETVVFLTSDNGGHPKYARHAPLRGNKWTLYEGGIRVPTLVRYPGVTEPNSIIHTPVIATDFYATLEEIAGLPASPRPDSASMLPLLRGETSGDFESRPLVWHFPYYNPEKHDASLSREIGIDNNENSVYRPMSAIRLGRFKLIRNYEDEVVELYDLENDIGEQSDLSESMPEKRDELRSALREYLSSVEARMPALNY